MNGGGTGGDGHVHGDAALLGMLRARDRELAQARAAMARLESEAELLRAAHSESSSTTTAAVSAAAGGG